MNIQILATILTGLVTITSLIISNYFMRRKEDRTKRLQIRIEYASKQIEEFYGPLYSLIQQMKNYKSVRQSIIMPQDIPPDEVNKIKIFFREEYQMPLNNEIRDLIKNKFHLIEGKELPSSFWTFLQYSTQQSAQVRLWKELQMETHHIQGTPWPNEFEEDVKKTVTELINRYDSLLKELE